MLISEINVYKQGEKVKAFSEQEIEYGHAWHEIKEKVVELMDAESGVVIYNTLQEVVRYKELFYEQLYLRDDLMDRFIAPTLAEIGNGDYIDDIVEDLEVELEVKDCLFSDEKDNIRMQIENYKYIEILMKEYEEYVVQYMDKSFNSSEEQDDYNEWEISIKEEIDNKEKELEEYLLKSRILQIERLCLVRNCIGKMSAQLIAENVEGNIAFRFCDEVDIDEVSEPSIKERKKVYGGLDSKLLRARNYYEEKESKVVVS